MKYDITKEDAVKPHEEIAENSVDRILDYLGRVWRDVDDKMSKAAQEKRKLYEGEYWST